jgi:Mn-containing catalase
VKADNDLALIRECHREKLTMYRRHVAVARLVSDYEFNNAYQYVINREETHLAWLEAAIKDLGGAPDTVPEPTVTAAAKVGKKNKNDAFLPLVADDAKAAEQFAAKWKPKALEIANERHRKLVQLMTGETLEQRRFFNHIGKGKDDLLGRRMDGASTGDGVMSVRWVD